MPAAPSAAGLALLRAAALTPAASGAEGARLGQIAAAIAAAAPGAVADYDSLGNLSFRFGAGDHPWLVVTAVDDPGYVVSAIGRDGYLRLQLERDRLPVPAEATLLFANPLTIATARGALTGIGAGLSVHLQPSRQPGTAPAYHLDNVYVDIGAATAAEAAAAGVAVLDPVTPEPEVFTAEGSSVWVGPALSSVAAVPVLAALTAKLAASAAPPAVVVAFATQGYFGHHGIERLVSEYAPGAVVVVRPAAGPDGTAAASDRLLFAAWQRAAGNVREAPLAPYWKRLVGQTPLLVVHPPLGHLHSGAEIFDTGELARLRGALGAFLAAETQRDALRVLPPLGVVAPSERVARVRPRVGQPPAPGLIGALRELVETTGVSGHEAPVRALVRRLIAREIPSGATVVVDASGNLVVSWGPAAAAKRILFIAHMDEIGWQVADLMPDGQLALAPEGFGLDAFYAHHVALVDTARGARVPGALYFVQGEGRRPAPRLDLGLSEAQARALGIAVGDAVAVPKRYRPLLGGRASARSFDDRVGCAALVAALGALRDYQPRDRRVIFAWSTGEELGLVGATALAERLHPTAVFAIDTFVSSDSPLENHRFADAPLGQGFVIRALDNGLIVPRPLVARVRALAGEHGIAVQSGATGGSTDGVPFLRGGSQVVALGWPLRYSHSPGEVIDTRDVAALAAIVPVLARAW